MVMENLCFFTTSISITWFRYYTILFQDITVVSNWVKGTEDLCIISYNYMLIYNSVKIKSLIKKIDKSLNENGG